MSGLEEIRVSANDPCRLCGKDDWCVYYEDESGEVVSIICPRTEDGADRDLGEAGYLHVIKERADFTNPFAPTAPVLIVEGASDWLVATELGFEAIGKPNSNGGTAALIKLLKDRVVFIISDNDDGAGLKGANTTAKAIGAVCSSVTVAAPPEGVKDLRDWYVTKGLTHEELCEYLEKFGKEVHDSELLKSDAPLDVASTWLDENYSSPSGYTIKVYKDQWYRYDGTKYCEYGSRKNSELRADLYKFLANKKVLNNKGKSDVVNIVPYNPSRRKIDDIVDALPTHCIVGGDMPQWLEEHEGDPRQLVSFKNGILDVSQYVKGNIVLYPPTPMFFTLASLPFDFNPDAKCPLTEDTMWSIFSQHQGKYDLAWEWDGYHCIYDNKHEKFMLCEGRSGAGKSTYLDIIKYTLGTDQVATPSLDDLSRQFGLDGLMGKLSIQFRDASVTNSFSSRTTLEILKKITGNDSLDVSRKFLPALRSVHFPGRITMAVNTLPDFPDEAATLRRRLLLLPFNEDFSKKPDVHLKEKLQQERPGMIVQALEGLKRLYTNGRFTSVVESRQRISEFQEMLSPITSFMRECCILNNKAHVAKDMIFDCWTRWCQSQGIPAGTAQQLAQKLYAYDRNVHSNRRMIQGERSYVYDGLELTEHAKELYLRRD
jgi:putative DNA primase/helicase